MGVRPAKARTSRLRCVQPLGERDRLTSEQILEPHRAPGQLVHRDAEDHAGPERREPQLHAVLLTVVLDHGVLGVGAATKEVRRCGVRISGPKLTITCTSAIGTSSRRTGAAVRSA